jgi:hypothetical protein
MIVEAMKKIGSPCLPCKAASGASSHVGYELSVQCVLPGYSSWFLLCQWMQCGCHVKLLLCYDSVSPFGSGVNLLCLSAKTILFYKCVVPK